MKFQGERLWLDISPSFSSGVSFPEESVIPIPEVLRQRLKKEIMVMFFRVLKLERMVEIRITLRPFLHLKHLGVSRNAILKNSFYFYSTLTNCHCYLCG